MSNNCTTKYIDEFCENFLSIDINVNSGGETTMEIEYVGGAPQTAKNELMAKYLPRAMGFYVGEYTSKRGPSGATSRVKYYDPVSKWANNATVGTLDSGGSDYVIGNEYFTVAGIPTVRARGSTRPIVFTAGSYKNLWPKLDKKSDKFTRYIDTSGRIRKLDPEIEPNKSFLEDVSIPGYPDPYVEFGEFKYTRGELLRGVFPYGVHPLSHNGGNTPYLAGSGLPKGLFSDSGTISSVMNGLASANGSVFTANSMLGHREGMGSIWNYSGTSGFGTRQIMSDMGLSIPNNAVSSSVTTSYFDSYSSGSTLTQKTAGRLPDERPGDMGPQVGGFEDGEMGRYEKPYDGGSAGGSEERDSSGSVKPVGMYSKINDTEKEIWVWLKMKDLGIVRELGIALLCEKGTQVEDTSAVRTLYGDDWVKDRTVYKDAKGKVNGGSPLEEAKKDLFPEIDEGVTIFNETALQNKVTNFNRYSYTTTWSGKDINRGGDPAGVRSGGNQYNSKPQNYVGFENYGSMDFPTGPKNWYSESGGTISFFESNENLSNTPFAEVESVVEYNLEGGEDEAAEQSGSPAEGAETIGQLFGIGESDSENGQGIIVLDFGPVIIPDFNGIDDADYTKNECIVDFTPSMFDSNKTVFGGVASVSTEALRATCKTIKENYEKVLDKALEQNPKGGTRITAYGNESTETSDRNKYKSPGGGREGRAGSRYLPGVKKYTKQNRFGPKQHNCTPSSAAFNRDWNQSTVSTAMDEYGGFDYSEGESVERMTHRLSCNGIDIGSITKVSFTLVNELYDFGQLADHMKYLDSLSINVSNGKLTATYSFSQKIMIPNYRKYAEGIASIKNLFG
jgi:hypothetical protein